MANAAQRIVTRLALRKANATGQDAENVRALLRSPLRLNAFTDALVEEQQSQSPQGPLLDFAQWLLTFVVENREELLALIQAIVTLFSSEEADA